jgi:hypothetical protein
MQIKRIIINGLLIVAVLSLSPQCSLTLPPPPPLEEMEITQPPSPDAVWVEGYWQWERWHHKYVWTQGYWKVKRHGEWEIVR